VVARLLGDDVVAGRVDLFAAIEIVAVGLYALSATR